MPGPGILVNDLDGPAGFLRADLIVTDTSERRLGSVDLADCTVRDATGRALGSVDIRGRICDSVGRVIGSVDGWAILNARNQQIATAAASASRETASGRSDADLAGASYLLLMRPDAVHWDVSGRSYGSLVYPPGHPT